MPKLTSVLLLAMGAFTVSANAQMTLPQLRMYEAMRDQERLNRALNTASEATKEEEQPTPDEHVSYSRIALLVGGIWLYTRRRRNQPVIGNEPVIEPRP